MTDDREPRHAKPGVAVATRHRPFANQNLSPVAEKANQEGASHCAAGNLRKGADSIREAVRIEPGCPEYQLNLGSILNALGDYEEAKTVLRRARTLAPAQIDIHKAIARAYTGLGEAKALADEYLQACKSPAR